MKQKYKSIEQMEMDSIVVTGFFFVNGTLAPASCFCADQKMCYNEFEIVTLWMN